MIEKCVVFVQMSNPCAMGCPSIAFNIIRHHAHIKAYRWAVTNTHTSHNTHVHSSMASSLSSLRWVVDEEVGRWGAEAPVGLGAAWGG